MNWFFWVLLALVIMFMVQGFRKGLIKTAVSMVFIIIVMIASSWLNPYVSGFIRENTDWQSRLEIKCSEIILKEMESRGNLPEESQIDFLEELPLPRTMREKLIENNDAEKYQQLSAENFTEYVSGYIAHGMINGIAFLLSFVIAIIILKIILRAVDLLTELPVLGTVNRLAGMIFGAVQGILWIWIAFLMISLLSETSAGAYLLKMIREDPILLWIYDSNYLMAVIMRILK